MRAENLVHGSDQQGCPPGRPAVMTNSGVMGVPSGQAARLVM